MFKSLFKVCSICNRKNLQLFMKIKENQYICYNCFYTFNKLNAEGYDNIFLKHSFEEIKQSLNQNKSLHTINFEKKFHDAQKQFKEWQNNNSNRLNNCLKNLNYLTPISQTTIAKKLYLKDYPYIDFSVLNKNTSSINYEKFIVIDTETTGLHPGTDELLEISAIKFIDGEPIECLSTLLHPKKFITYEITNINHITNEMVFNSPNIENVIDDFNRFIKGYNLVAYNADFDFKFLYKNGLNLFEEKRKYFDVWQLSKNFFKDCYLENYKLDTIADYMGFKRNNAHRATDDALVTGLIFNYIGKSKKGK